MELLNYIDPPLSIEEPNHDLKLKWFMEYLDSPMGAKMGQGRMVVAVFVRKHAELAQQQGEILAAAMGGMDAAAQSALLEKQRQVQMEQAQLEQQKEAQKQQFKAGEIQNKNLEAEKDRKHDFEMVDKELEADKELAVLESGLSITEEHNKPKEPTKPAKKK